MDEIITDRREHLSNDSSNHDKLYFHLKKREWAPTGHRGGKIMGCYFDIAGTLELSTEVEHIFLTANLCI